MNRLFAANKIAKSMQQQRCMSTVPINQVARIVRMKLNGQEEVAVQADAMVNGLAAKFSAPDGPKGYVKTVRKLCKTEWVYEICVVFDNLENFKGYMESDFKKNNADAALVTAKALCDGEIYVGARVYDEITK